MQLDDEVLRKTKEARELIADRRRWTQHALARSKDLSHVPPLSPKAVCWCAIGAVCKVCNVDAYYDSPLGLQIVALLTGHRLDIVFANDYMGHETVLEMFDEAIGAAAPPLAEEV